MVKMEKGTVLFFLFLRLRSALWLFKDILTGIPSCSNLIYTPWWCYPGCPQHIQIVPHLICFTNQIEPSYFRHFFLDRSNIGCPLFLSYTPVASTEMA